MKKWMSAVLAAAMMVCLGGCVSQEDYDALQTENESLQTTIEELRATNDTLQSNYDTASSGNALYEKYNDVVDAMEAESYEEAIEAIQDRMPEPAYSEVAITTDNWEDYFTLTTYEAWDINAFNEADGLTVYYALVPKDDIKDKLVESEPGTLSAEIKYRNNFCSVSFDWNNESYDIIEKENDGEDQTETVECDYLQDLGFFAVDYMEAYDCDGSGYKNAMMSHDDFSVLRVTGSIFLYNE